MQWQKAGAGFMRTKKPGPWAAQSSRSPYIGPPWLPRTPGLLCVSSMDAQFPVGSLGRGKKGSVLSAMPAGCPCLHSVLLAWGKPVMTVAVSGRRFHSARCETPRRGGVQRDEHPGTKKILIKCCDFLFFIAKHQPLMIFISSTT